MLGEIVSLAIMLAGAVAFIKWLAFIAPKISEVATTRETGGGRPSIGAGRRGSGHGKQHTRPSHWTER